MKKKKVILKTDKEHEAKIDVEKIGQNTRSKKNKPSKPDKMKGMYSWD